MQADNGNNKSVHNEEPIDDLFDVKMTPEPAKRPRRIRKLCKKIYIESIRDLPVKICYCRFCQPPNNEELAPQLNTGLLQIVKNCIIKILQHCLMGCLQNEDQTDGTDEASLIKSMCLQISRPQIVWLIINISDKMSKLYFTRDTLNEVKAFIESIEKSKEPLLLMKKICDETPISLKRLICQTVTKLDYKCMLM